MRQKKASISLSITHLFTETSLLYRQTHKMAESEIDTTLTPTDQSTTFSTTLDSSSSTRHDLTGEELERRQLLHKVQLLKLEVSQKNLVIDALKNEQSSQVEELQEKLSDALHEKKLLQMRLRSMTQASTPVMGS